MDSREKTLAAFQSYYEANVSGLIWFTRRFVPADIGEDIIHDVFLDIWENINSFDQLPNRSYLFMAVRNRCLNILKREEIKNNYVSYMQIEKQRMGLDYYDSFEKLLIQKEGLTEVYNQIELLPPKCREIFKLAYFEEKKNVEIAELLKLSVRTVEHQLYLALKTLRDKLQPKEKKTRKFFIFF